MDLYSTGNWPLFTPRLTLSDEHNAVSGKLALAESRQNDAQTMDAVGVFLVLIPPSALTGDSEGEVAQYKGEKLAIERSRKKKNC